MRVLGIFFTLILAIFLLLFLAFSRAPDMLANNLSKKLGTAVSIDSMKMGYGNISLRKMEIGNPKGYTLPKAFSAEQIDISAPLPTYFKDVIVIDEIGVHDVYLDLEFDSLTAATGNWSKMLAQYKKNGRLDAKKGKVLIKKLILTNVQTDLIFRNQGTSVKKLPTIRRMEFKNVTTEGGSISDQLLGSVLGQMLKEVFIENHLNNMIKGLLDSPQNAVDSFLKPFKGLFNTAPIEPLDILFVEYN